jgi:hypothetical protein
MPQIPRNVGQTAENRFPEANKFFVNLEEAIADEEFA